jgi:hypothetical protein
LIEQSRYIGELDARQKIAELYLLSLGAAQLRDFTRLFGWSPADAQHAFDRLEKTGRIQQNITVENQSGSFFALAELVSV